MSAKQLIEINDHGYKTELEFTLKHLKAEETLAVSINNVKGILRKEHRGPAHVKFLLEFIIYKLKDGEELPQSKTRLPSYTGLEMVKDEKESYQFSSNFIEVNRLHNRLPLTFFIKGMTFLKLKTSSLRISLNGVQSQFKFSPEIEQSFGETVVALREINSENEVVFNERLNLEPIEERKKTKELIEQGFELVDES